MQNAHLVWLLELHPLISLEQLEGCVLLGGGHALLVVHAWQHAEEEGWELWVFGCLQTFLFVSYTALFPKLPQFIDVANSLNRITGMEYWTGLYWNDISHSF